MKLTLCTIIFCSMSLSVQASENNSKLLPSKNPIVPRADTLTGQIEHAKSQAQLLEIASRKSYTDNKIQTQVSIQKNKEQAQNLAKQQVYNEIILACSNKLGLVDTDKITLERKELRSVGMALYEVLDADREEDQPIFNTLDGMYRNLENRYCFKKPSKSRIERERLALFTVVNQRLLQINDENEIADDASSGNGSLISASAPAQAIAVDAKTGHYRRWL